MDRKSNQDTSNIDAPEKLSNAQKAELRQEWVDELISGCSTEADLLGPEVMFTRLKGAVMSRLLEADEICGEDHGYWKIVESGMDMFSCDAPFERGGRRRRR